MAEATTWRPPIDRDAIRRLLDRFSLEMTGKDVPALEQAAEFIRPGTRISVTFLGNEDLAMRTTAAAAAVRRLGFVPVPHISARRLASRFELEQFLDSLVTTASADEVFVAGGDPRKPLGPYRDALAVIRSGLLGKYRIRNVGVAGYPAGHPDIDDTCLWSALVDKHAALQQQGHEMAITTQFGFDANPIMAWLSELRRREVLSPVSIGVPGPAGVRRLLNYARRFGVDASAGIVRKYGFTLAGLLGTAGPGSLIQALAEKHDLTQHGPVGLHFYTFGGLRSTATWIRDVHGELGGSTS